MSTAILQPIIPHYRKAFFDGLSTELKYDLYSFGESFGERKNLFNVSEDCKKIKVFKLWKFKWFNPFPFLLKYDSVVIPGELSYLSNWILIFFSYFFRVDLIIWGHGLNYSKKQPISIGYIVMYFFCKSAIFYTEKEYRFWRRKFPNKRMTFLNNTLHIDTNEINLFHDKNNINEIKEKFNINKEIVFISCYRFTNPYRKDDELYKLIQKYELTRKDVGFIIIGEGILKPDFSNLSNVYDFSELYDPQIKLELFYISDFYLQLGWTGLSIVEAFAHKKPVITLKRSINVMQSVEYSYLNIKNSIILKSINDFDKVFLDNKTILQLGNNAQKTYIYLLKMSSMIKKFTKFFYEK